MYIHLLCAHVDVIIISVFFFPLSEASMLSAKSRHYQAEKEWSIHKDMLQTRNKLKEEENAHKVYTLNKTMHVYI